MKIQKAVSNLKFEKCDALRNLVPFVRFKKREKLPQRNVNFSKVTTLLKLTLLHGCFSRFLNCTNGTKSCNAPQMLKLISELRGEMGSS